jgi:hypothetical protein
MSVPPHASHQELLGLRTGPTVRTTWQARDDSRWQACDDKPQDQGGSSSLLWFVPGAGLYGRLISGGTLFILQLV